MPHSVMDNPKRFWYSYGMDNTTGETYKARYLRTRGWIANHVCQDLMLMHGRDAIVSTFDETKILDAEARDAAVATLPAESRLFDK
jgi:hypothetical protein